MNDTDTATSSTSSFLPLTPEGVQAFLSGPWVEGIGPAFAARLVERFGTDALRVLADTPEKAATIAGLGPLRIAQASESLRKLPYPAELPAFLCSCGVGEVFADRILDKYGNQTLETIVSDPYSMVEEVWQLSFFTADKIGRALGIADDDPRRLRGALLTGVKHYAEDGHLFARPGQAVDYAASITKVSPEKIEGQIQPLIDAGRLTGSRGGLYLPVFYKAEKEGAGKLLELAASKLPAVAESDIPEGDSEGRIYSPAQRAAIREALSTPVMVLTGGPGSGKTTILRAIIENLRKQGKKVVLAAPTGRAAKRMTTLTGAEASTIHRLLGYRSGEGYNKRMIDADVLIIDEGSMMEQVLLNHLLQAVRPGTRLIMVGDVDQLPAIGAGDVLRDLIDSGVVPVARLDENFRQARGSTIAAAAKAINKGEKPASEAEGDFLIFEEDSPARIHDRIISLITKELPKKRGIAPADITVVTPQQIGPLGARRLNTDLQERINPEGPELRRGATAFRLGDPVLQKTNSRERGVYNGELGRIDAVDPEAETLDVVFADGRRSTYGRKDLGELVHAYATTVHKLQGSELKNIIIPVTMAHKPMLYRNLLYTGVSRAGELCVLVAEPEALEHAIATTPATKRNSNFRHRLRAGLQGSCQRSESR
ncbi:MAG: AAA family ATPase [Muribaculaceae bacterium]|nr:AAA family ATPase [Muribaculaceae bacterium]